MKFLQRFKNTYVDILFVVIFWIYFLSKGISGVWQILGFILTLLSAVFWLFARWEINDAFSVRPMARKIVSTGVYSKIRHPIYIASILTGLGFCLMAQKWYVYVLVFCLLVVQLLRAMQEEKILTKTFGQEYIEYKKSTWF
jgi:protein-S-isoprenylcysteine O-methyltransferase Ste14